MQFNWYMLNACKMQCSGFEPQHHIEWEVAVHTCNPNTLKAEYGISEIEANLVNINQPWKHTETLCQINKQFLKKTNKTKTVTVLFFL